MTAMNLELDLVNGLPTLTPDKDGNLRLSEGCVVPVKDAKCDLTSASIGFNEKEGFFIAISIKRTAGEKFNLLENLMTRDTESMDGDERFKEYRKHLATAMKLALANGVAKLAPGVTMADIEKAKNVRWARYAGCSLCPCSPAFSTKMLIATGESSWRTGSRRRPNWLSVELTLKPASVIKVITRMSEDDAKKIIEVPA